MVTNSAQETQELGEKIAADLKPGSASWRILALYGELGSGKTTFIQGLARGLGIKKRIISPTFIFIRQYPISPKLDAKILYHVDLYRIEETSGARGLGLKEIFADKEGIIVIEWADRIKKILPKKRTDIHFEYLGENQRRIKIETID